jgi:hypothetical protein
VLRRGMPYVVCDTEGTPVTPEEAKKIIAEHWTVPPQVRGRRRSTKHKIHKAKGGKAPQQVLAGHERSDARGADKRGDLPQPRSCDHAKIKRKTA